jgi:DNA-binding PadR family transcriptional regulator
MLLNADEPLWALDVARSTDLSYGTVYHSFRVLYDLGWAVGDTEASHPGRPPRVRYRLTVQGRAQARALLGENT